MKVLLKQHEDQHGYVKWVMPGYSWNYTMKPWEKLRGYNIHCLVSSIVHMHRDDWVWMKVRYLSVWVICSSSVKVLCIYMIKGQWLHLVIIVNPMFWVVWILQGNYLYSLPSLLVNSCHFHLQILLPLTDNSKLNVIFISVLSYFTNCYFITWCLYTFIVICLITLHDRHHTSPHPHFTHLYCLLHIIILSSHNHHCMLSSIVDSSSPL